MAQHFAGALPGVSMTPGMRVRAATLSAARWGQAHVGHAAGQRRGAALARAARPPLVMAAAPEVRREAKAPQQCARCGDL
jgi:hypothetical protein